MEEKDGTSPMNKNVEERILHPKSGMAMLFLLIAAIVGSIVLMIFSGAVISREQQYPGRCLCDGCHPDPVRSLCGTGGSEGDQPQRSTCSGFVRKVLRNPQ